MLAQGFPHFEEIPMYSVDGRAPVSDWQILVFTRDWRGARVRPGFDSPRRKTL